MREWRDECSVPSAQCRVLSARDECSVPSAQCPRRVPSAERSATATKQLAGNVKIAVILATREASLAGVPESILEARYHGTVILSEVGGRA